MHIWFSTVKIKPKLSSLTADRDMTDKTNHNTVPKMQLTINYMQGKLFHILNQHLYNKLLE